MFPHESACAPGPSSDVGVVSPVCGPNSSLSVGEDAAIKALLSASLGARLDFGDEWTDGCEDMQGGIPRARHGSMLERRVPLDASPMQSPYTNGHPLQAWQQTGMDGLGNAEWNASSSLASSIVASAPYSAPRGSTTLGKRNLASSRGRTIAPPREDRPAAAAAAAMASMGVRKSNTKRARYDDDFKELVVREAMRCPEGARIKPTCSRYPGVEPCQLRKWIQKFAPLINER